MDSKVFEECLQAWRNSDGAKKFWPMLAEKWGYKDGESLRLQFKNQRKKMGIRKDEPEKIKNKCRILLFDIETSPINALVWGLWDQNVNLEAILNDWHLLSWSAKYLFDDEVMSDVLTSEEAKDHDDERIVKSIWQLLDDADIVISFNGDRFDCKKLNTRFLVHGLNPPSHYQSIDLLYVAKQSFSFSSNRLQYINEYLGLPQKTDTTFDLWKRAWLGNKEALKDLETYNKNDTAILEDLYLKLRGFIKNHPNMNLWNEESVSLCPNCGSEKLNWNKEYYTFTGRYKAFRCDNCGALGRSRQLDIDMEKRKTIVR